MKPIFFTPGPAELYPTVPSHIQDALQAQVPSISHRSKAYEAIHRHAVDGVKALLSVPDDFHVFFFSSATEIWERLLQNCVKAESFHFVNGAFSSRFFETAGELNLSPHLAEAEWGQGFDFPRIEVPTSVEMINFTQNETSTGVMTPMEAVYAFRNSHPEALLTLDMVSSVPYPEINWQLLDAAYFSVQKGFGLPAGLGVLIASPRCITRSDELLAQGHATGSYHSFQSLLSKARKNQTPETPNVLNIYLLGKVCEDMLAKGVNTIRGEINHKADRLYHFFDQHDRFQPFVHNISDRSRTVVVVDIPEGSSTLLQHLKEKGMVVGDGYGKLKGKQLRIANFPAVSEAAVDTLIKGLQAF